MIFEKLFQGQPEGIFGIGYNDPSTVGIICTVILLILVFSGVRVVFAAVRRLGLRSLILGADPESPKPPISMAKFDRRYFLD